MQEIRDASPGLVLPIIVFILIRASYSDILLLKNLSDIPESNRVHQKSNQAFTVLFNNYVTVSPRGVQYVPVCCKANGVRNQLARQ